MDSKKNKPSVPRVISPPPPPPPATKKILAKILLPLKTAGQIPLPLEKENNVVNETKRLQPR